MLSFFFATKNIDSYSYSFDSQSKVSFMWCLLKTIKWQLRRSFAHDNCNKAEKLFYQKNSSKITYQSRSNVFVTR
jgi:hypothetical protein